MHKEAITYVGPKRHKKKKMGVFRQPSTLQVVIGQGHCELYLNYLASLDK